MRSRRVVISHARAFSTALADVTSGAVGSLRVNAHHMPDVRVPLPFEPRENQLNRAAISKEHWQGEWSAEDIRAAQVLDAVVDIVAQYF